MYACDDTVAGEGISRFDVEGLNLECEWHVFMRTLIGLFGKIFRPIFRRVLRLLFPHSDELNHAALGTCRSAATNE